MLTIAQRIEQLRTQKGLSRPALSAALGLPRMAVEKFESGRQTPTQEQQNRLAAFFGVSAAYLRGEDSDPTRMEDWMDGAFQDAAPAAPPPVSTRQSRPADPDGGAMFDAFLRSRKFQESLRAAVLDVLRTPEGQAMLAKALQKRPDRR